LPVELMRVIFSFGFVFVSQWCYIGWCWRAGRLRTGR
jgi:hypothetical protein